VKYVRFNSIGCAAKQLTISPATDSATILAADDALKSTRSNVSTVCTMMREASCAPRKYAASAIAV
jgi:hypothetical protein